MDECSDRIDDGARDQEQDCPHQMIDLLLKAEEASFITFDCLKNTVRKNGMTGIAATRIAISL